ncbi:hypothetical protein [Priestia koreensis]|uniref:hypothetical protein n=1 Tax=Priestia koreensis TaxID=284581 RepID=UPI00345B2B4D
MDNERLVIWEPLEENPFCRYTNEMQFVEMHYQKDFVLVFEDFKTQKIYRFTYEQSKAQTYAIVSYRFFDELTRPDIDTLIDNLFKEQGNSSYRPTFYKMENSEFISWYDKVYSARVGMYPNTEHHVYLTADYVLEVLSEYEPTVTIESK